MSCGDWDLHAYKFEQCVSLSCFQDEPSALAGPDFSVMLLEVMPTPVLAVVTVPHNLSPLPVQIFNPFDSPMCNQLFTLRLSLSVQYYVSWVLWELIRTLSMLTLSFWEQVSNSEWDHFSCSFPTLFTPTSMLRMRYLFNKYLFIEWYKKLSFFYSW